MTHASIECTVTVIPAAELGISEITLQIYRGKIMQKMEAASLADLVRIAEKLEVPITHSRHARVGSR
jgi:FixJ family two-component response regulator